jgi:hypothetical protein
MKSESGCLFNSPKSVFLAEVCRLCYDCRSEAKGNVPFLLNRLYGPRIYNWRSRKINCQRSKVRKQWCKIFHVCVNNLKVWHRLNKEEDTTKCAPVSVRQLQHVNAETLMGWQLETPTCVTYCRYRTMTLKVFQTFTEDQTADQQNRLHIQISVPFIFLLYFTLRSFFQYGHHL